MSTVYSIIIFIPFIIYIIIIKNQYWWYGTQMILLLNVFGRMTMTRGESSLWSDDKEELLIGMIMTVGIIGEYLWPVVQR